MRPAMWPLVEMYLARQVNRVPDHDGVVGENGGREVGTRVQALRVNLTLQDTQATCKQAN
jgi:hypothetical protein